MLPPSYTRKSAGPATNSSSVSDEYLLAIHNRVNMARLNAEEQRAVFGRPLERIPTILEVAPGAAPHDTATASPSKAMTMQQLMSVFERELQGIQRVASCAGDDDNTRTTMWFNLCAYAFELIRALGLDDEAALKVISIRHLLGDRHSMPEAARHVLRGKLQDVIKELEQGQGMPDAAEEQVGSESDQSSLDTLIDAELGPYHPGVDAECLEQAKNQYLDLLSRALVLVLAIQSNSEPTIVLSSLLQYVMHHSCPFAIHPSCSNATDDSIMLTGKHKS